MKEYSFEQGKVDIKRLEVPFMEKESYVKSHKNLIIPCHDIFIKYQEGILLIKRKTNPAKSFIWSIGGRILRGQSMEESLRHKVLEECNLKLETIKELGNARTFFQTDPFGHGKGTDTLNFVYFGEGIGELKLNELHEQPIIVKKEDYTEEFRNKLHPYVKKIYGQSNKIFIKLSNQQSYIYQNTSLSLAIVLLIYFSLYVPLFFWPYPNTDPYYYN